MNILSISKARLFRICAAATAIVMASGEVTQAQLPLGTQDLEIVSPPSGGRFLRWQRKEGRTYFIQVSTSEAPLQKWTFLPLIEYGPDAVVSFEITTATPSAFFRLNYTDDAIQQGETPETMDFDNDGISTQDEIYLTHTDPLDPDTDGDGMDDGWETQNSLDPNDSTGADGADGDPDNDGLSNLLECLHGADPNLSDTDGDGLTDGAEVHTWQTSPVAEDSDLDGLEDFAEVSVYGSSPSKWDTDGDTLGDGDEILLHGTNPLTIDSDGDWMWDDYELDNGLDPVQAADGLLDADSDTLANQLEFVFRDHGYDPMAPNNAAAFPWAEDPDRDGLTTQTEFVTHLTNPRQHDTDLDKMNDAWEMAYGFNPRLNNILAGPANQRPDADPDGDGLSNELESFLDTNPNAADTDGDGVNDDVEIEQGSDARDPNDELPPPAGTVPVRVKFGDDSGSHSEKYQIRLIPLEGAPPTVVTRTNSTYGTPETHTLRLPKGAKYRVELDHASTDPEYRDEPDPDYDYTFSFDEDFCAIVVDDPQGISGNHWESETFFADGKSATLYVPLFKVKEVSFWNSTVGLVTNDGEILGTDVVHTTPYEAPHWTDVNSDGDAEDDGECKSPIAYVCNTAPSIEARISVKPTGLVDVPGFLGRVRVRGTGPGAIRVESTPNSNANTLVLPSTPSSGSFPDHVDFLNPMEIAWQVIIDGRVPGHDAGTSGNRTYVTLAVPQTTIRQETLFDIACRPAAGKTDAAQITAAIWDEFTDRVVNKVDPKPGTPTGTPMTYYKDYLIKHTGTSQLIADGDGQCGAWVRLFLDARKLHGLKETNNIWQVVPKGSETGFLVKNWTFEGNGNRSNPLMPYVNIVGDPFKLSHSYNWKHAVVTDEAGIAGQSESNPASSFKSHFVARVDDTYYDPSYGVTYAGIAEIDEQIAGFYTEDSDQPISEITTGWDINEDGDTNDTVVAPNVRFFRKNNAGVDLQFQNDGYFPESY